MIPFQIFTHCIKRGTKRRLMDHIRSNPEVQFAQNRQQIFLSFQVVNSVHQKAVRSNGFVLLRRLKLTEKQHQLFRIRRETLGVVVPAAQKRGKN
nr:hypothetical protein [uncultured Victivallis sp.]